MRNDHEILAETFDLLTAYGALRQTENDDALVAAMTDRWARILEASEAGDVLQLTLAIAEVAWQMAEIASVLYHDGDKSLAGQFIAASRDGVERLP